MVDAAKPKPKKAGGVFFSLIDEMEASERRLDEAAAPLLAEMQEAEKEATVAIEGRRAKVAAGRDYIKRMHAVTDELKEGEGNGGPSLTGGSAESPQSSQKDDGDGSSPQ